MATLKEHQAAMVDLLANGSGIPASASRLAHAMHDVLESLLNGPDDTFEAVLKQRKDATTPGLNDKALSKPQEALKTDRPAKWPTPAEHRVKELENTIKQLKANNAKLKQERDHLAKCYDGVPNNMIAAYEREQAGCRNEEQSLSLGVSYAELGMKYAELVKILAFYGVDDLNKARAEYLKYNGSQEQAGCRKPDTRVCEHEWVENAELGRPLWIMCEKCGAHK